MIRLSKEVSAKRLSIAFGILTVIVMICAGFVFWVADGLSRID